MSIHFESITPVRRMIIHNLSGSSFLGPLQKIGALGKVPPFPLSMDLPFDASSTTFSDFYYWFAATCMLKLNFNKSPKNWSIPFFHPIWRKLILSWKICKNDDLLQKLFRKMRESCILVQKNPILMNFWDFFILIVPLRIVFNKIWEVQRKSYWKLNQLFKTIGS